LFGTKCDLKDDKEIVDKLAKEGQSPISQSQGENMAREIKAIGYMECSALTQKGLKNVFDEAIKAVVFPPKKKGKGRKGDCLMM